MKPSRLTHFTNLVLTLALVLGLLGLAHPAQASAPLLAELWVTNGPVYATLLSGSTLYIGGDFDYVGPPTGGFAALDAGGGPDLAFPPVNGCIHAIAPDGTGGWYLGGSFTSVGGHPRNNLAHLQADHSLDFAWDPDPDSAVLALAVAPPISGMSGSTVYAGGDFATIGGQARNYIAALSANTGLATSWDPNADSIVSTLTVSGSTVYAGGEFTTIGGEARNSIAALNAVTGLATSWDPDADSVVSALVVSGSTIYAGGDFTTIGGETRNFIAALDASTGDATGWNPDADFDVMALAVSGSTVYAGGFFATIGREDRNFIAALDADTGFATAWDPNADFPVNALAVAPPVSGGSGSTVYAGGMFKSIGREDRNFIAALDAGTGFATAWDPNADSWVQALAVAPPISGVSGGSIGTGGEFTSIGGQTRNFIAALDTNTGLPTPWDPNADDSVYALAVNGSTVYAGGYFTNIGGQPRNSIAALNASTGLATTTWDSNADSAVYALAVSGSTVYAGGEFGTIDGEPRNYIAALDASTGSATTWDPDADSYVYALAVSGNTVYAGGEFGTIGRKTRNYIAALDASTGLATPWDPNADNYVYALAIASPISGVSSNTVYAGGDFSTIGREARNYIAALDASTGFATAWDPDADYSVYALAANSSTVYAGGDFSTIGRQTRNYIAALDASTGFATAWDPNADYSVYTLVVAPPTSGLSGNTVYAGGEFSAIGELPHSYLAALRDGAATCQSAGSGGSWQVSNWSNCGNAIPGDGDSVSVQAGHTLTLYGSLAANDLTIAAGGELDLPLGGGLTLEGALTHNGRITQTLAVPTSATTTFLNLTNAAGTADKFFGLTLAPAGDMGHTRVTIKGNQDCTTNPASALIRRCFDITPTTAQNATARFYYTNAELNGQIFDQLKLWHWSAGWSLSGDTYSRSTTCDASQQDCWMEAQSVSSYSPFVLGSGSQPTAVRLQSFVARADSPFEGMTLVGLLLLGLSGAGLVHVRRR